MCLQYVLQSYSVPVLAYSNVAPAMAPASAVAAPPGPLGVPSASRPPSSRLYRSNADSSMALLGMVRRMSARRRRSCQCAIDGRGARAGRGGPARTSFIAGEEGEHAAARPRLPHNLQHSALRGAQG